MIPARRAPPRSSLLVLASGASRTDTETAASSEHRPEEYEADPSAPEAPERPAAKTDAGDAIASRALNQGFLGLVLFPPAFHLWSAWTLIQLAGSGRPLSAKGRRRALFAGALDLIVILAATAILARVLS